MSNADDLQEIRRLLKRIRRRVKGESVDKSLARRYIKVTIHNMNMVELFLNDAEAEKEGES